MGCSIFCNFIRPLIVGSVGFKFTYFLLCSGFLSCVLLFIVFLIWFWYILVGFVFEIWKLLSVIKLWIFSWYCFMGSMSMEFPLSTEVSIALLFCIFAMMFYCVVLKSCWYVFIFILLL